MQLYNSTEPHKNSHLIATPQFHTNQLSNVIPPLQQIKIFCKYTRCILGRYNRVKNKHLSQKHFPSSSEIVEKVQAKRQSHFELKDLGHVLTDCLTSEE